ncbi:MAG: hypothetical protein IPH44_00380 [Myxococcales bacterium]|nr:hypothetical protein [Myxococcales bacterium]
MRSCALPLLLVACHGGASPAPTTARPPTLCDGLGAEACQDRALVQSVCLIEPDHASCAPLRAGGWLPAPPPPLASLYGCRPVLAPRADVGPTWFCLAADAIAVRVGDRWDVWPHAAWTRADTAAVAGWRASAADGRTLWLSVAPVAPPRVHLADDTGALATWLGDGDPAARGAIEDERAALPTPAAVCAAARACRDAIPRPVAAGAEDAPVDDPIAAAVTLQQCLAAWTDASRELELLGSLARPPLAAAPPACGELTRGGDGWPTTIAPPASFRGLRGSVSSAAWQPR